MHLLANTFANVLFFAGLTLAAGILLRRFWKYQRVLKKQKKKKTVTPMRNVKANVKPSASPLADAPAEVLRWQVELEERSRDLNAILDSKMSALQSLIAHAAAERERLEQATRKAAEFTPTELRNKGYEQIAGIIEVSPAVFPQVIADDSRRKVYALVDQGQTIHQIADNVGLSAGDVELILSSRAAG